tara:strand:+ start:72 stop:275 length:204 start_codon:yes stop_codon:yes gene_type:complete
MTLQRFYHGRYQRMGFALRVKDYMNFDQLEEYFSANEHQPDELLSPDRVKKHLETVEAFLGKLMVAT